MNHCEDCAYWDPVHKDAFIGECKRRAPTHPQVITLTVSDSKHLSPVWPETTQKDWCGDFAPKPTIEGGD